MTTDNGATAVAEPTDVAAEAEDPQTQDATLASDAGEQAGANAAATEPDLEAETAAALAESKGKESANPPPEAEDEPPPFRAVVDPDLTRQAIETYRKHHTDRQAQLDAYEAELVEEGMSPALAKRFVKDSKDILNSHHADGLSFAAFEAVQERMADEKNLLVDGVGKGLPNKAATERFWEMAQKTADKRPDKLLTYSALANTLYTLGQEDGRSASYDDGFTKGYRAGRTKAAATAASATSGNVADGTSSGGKFYSQLSPPERAAMSPGQRDAEVAREARERRT